MNTRRGEISTIVILTTFAVLAVATLVTTTLNKEIQTTETQASGVKCPLLENPKLISGGKCQVAINTSTTLVCALIDPSKPAGQQLVAGQDIPNQPKPQPGTMSWTIANGTGTVQLHKDPAITINAGTQYRVVVYNWEDTAGCVTETDIPGSTVISLFAGNNSGGGSSGGGANPTSALAPTSPPPTVTPICTQTNYIHCPNSIICVPTLSECAGVVTNTPVPAATATTVPNAPTAQPIQAISTISRSEQRETVTVSSPIYLPACDGSGNYDACFKIDSNSI